MSYNIKTLSVCVNRIMTKPNVIKTIVSDTKQTETDQIVANCLPRIVLKKLLQLWTGKIQAFIDIVSPSSMVLCPSTRI